MKFSIVVATYNRSGLLRRCIVSVLAQTYRNFELIIVDDGSTDDTEVVVNSIADNRVRYIKLDKNYGTATPARNRGIDEMTGDALIIWDSDDVLLPNALMELEIGFKQFPVAVVCTSTDFYKDDVIVKNSRIPTGLITVTDWVAGNRPKDAEIIAIHKDLIGDTRFRSRGIDFMFYIEVLARYGGKIAYMNETCGKVFLESDELSLTKKRKKMNSALSQERGEIFNVFLPKYKHLYFEAGVEKKYAAYAYGAAVGLLLNGKQRKAIRWAWEACHYSKKPTFILFLFLTLLPFASSIFIKLIPLVKQG
jgi:glycosyltransferase involved in cell wall biosynthesis